MVPGRKRGPNFTIQEKLKIIEIVTKQKQIIKSRINTVDSIKAKGKAWADITEEYNSELWTFKRTSPQLKLCYESIRKASRQNDKHKVKSENINQTQNIEIITNDKSEEHLTEICDPIIKIENPVTTVEMDLAAITPCPQLQEDMITNAVEEVLPNRLVRSSTLTERYNQQEMRFRQDEHDLDMQIKLQKLENERRIYDRLALETNLLRLESKVMMKSLRTWNLKF